MIKLIIAIFIFIIINVILAKIDANKILANKKINHLVNALIYGALAAVNFFFFKGLALIFMLSGVLIIRKLVFDIMLNIFRGKSWKYISTTTTSKIDQFENRIFGYNGAIKYCVYFGLLIINIVILFLL